MRSTTSPGRHRKTFYKTKIATVISSMFCNSLVLGAPAGGAVVNGQVTITARAANTVVNQTTDKAVINWQDFDINANESVQFLQPGSTSFTLNRVLNSGDGTQIYGQLTANGGVMLIDANGVLFGQGSKVDVNSLLATTANINDNDFLSGNFQFNAPTGTGSVINLGDITISEGGFAALVAPTVENSGVINARLGRVVLGGTQSYVIDPFGDDLIHFQLSDNAAIDTSVTNSGDIFADGGSVLLATSGLSDIISGVINMDGMIEATAVEQVGGKVILHAGEVGTTYVSGSVNLSGTDTEQIGGTFQALGNRVAIRDGASINASGSLGGGSINIGGNFRGEGPLLNADKTYFAEGATVSADALLAGDGGDVIVWADGSTQFYGNISSTGGLLGGNGGFAEVSGKESILILQA